MKRISMVGTFPPHKGISDTCVEQVKALSEFVKITFIDFRRLYPKRLYPGEMTVKGFAAPSLDNAKIHRVIAWYNPLSWIKAAFLVRGEILHVHWWTYVLFLPLFTVVWINRLRGRKIVCNVHNVLGHESNVVDRHLSAIFLKHIDRLIAHTPDSKRKLRRLFDIEESRISVIPLGIPEFIVGHSPKPEARNQLGIPLDRKVILSFGHIRKYKGIDVLIEAFSQVRKEMKSALLVIAGETWVDWLPYQNLIDQLRLNEDVVLKLEFISIDEVKYYFCAADLVVLPYTRFDAQSGPGRIALGYGKPMVVSNAGGLPYLVPAECVSQSGDAQDLSNKIISVLSSRRRLKQLSKYSVEKNEELQWSNICKQTLKLYERS